MVEMLTRMQGEIELKGLIQEMQVMKAIRLFSVFHELSLLQAKQMFSVTIAMRKAIMLVNVRNQKFVIQTDENAKTVPSYDAMAVSQVHASSKVHEQVSHGKRKTIIQTKDDDQIDSNLIFDDPFVENNGGTSEHDSTTHDEYHEIQMLAYNVQREAKNKKRLNNELKQQKHLLQQELKMFKDRVKTSESKIIQYSTYKETCDELERELRNDKDTIDRLVKEKEKNSK
nr:hypothetical protein [Tanacetum cinerariifolium]